MFGFKLKKTVGDGLDLVKFNYQQYILVVHPPSRRRMYSIYINKLKV